MIRGCHVLAGRITHPRGASITPDDTRFALAGANINGALHNYRHGPSSRTGGEATSADPKPPFVVTWTANRRAPRRRRPVMSQFEGAPSVQGPVWDRGGDRVPLRDGFPSRRFLPFGTANGRTIISVGRCGEYGLPDMIVERPSAWLPCAGRQARSPPHSGCRRRPANQRRA